MSSIKSRRKRAGGRAGNAGRRGSSSILQMPWGLTENIDEPTEPLSEEGVNAIHLGAMEILEEIGLEILNREALAILSKAGCIVVGENVKFDREFIMEMINKAPSQFDIIPRNPNKKITQLKMSEISKLNQNFIIKKIDNKTVNISVDDNEMLMAIVGQFDQNLKNLSKLTKTDNEINLKLDALSSSLGGEI